MVGLFCHLKRAARSVTETLGLSWAVWRGAEAAVKVKPRETFFHRHRGGTEERLNILPVCLNCGRSGGACWVKGGSANDWSSILLLHFFFLTAKVLFFISFFVIFQVKYLNIPKTIVHPKIKNYLFTLMLFRPVWLLFYFVFLYLFCGTSLVKKKYYIYLFCGNFLIFYIIK